MRGGSVRRCARTLSFATPPVRTPVGVGYPPDGPTRACCLAITCRHPRWAQAVQESHPPRAGERGGASHCPGRIRPGGALRALPPEAGSTPIRTSSGWSSSRHSRRSGSASIRCETFSRRWTPRTAGVGTDTGRVAELQRRLAMYRAAAEARTEVLHAHPGAGSADVHAAPIRGIRRAPLREARGLLLNWPAPLSPRSDRWRASRPAARHDERP
jgi:hypothetical protein